MVNHDKICEHGETECQCSSMTPCFCTTSYYTVDSEMKEIERMTNNLFGEYTVTWSLNIENRKYLLEWDYLTSGLQKILKDYLNNDILCNGDPTMADTLFYGVEIFVQGDDVIAKGYCRGQQSNCNRSLNSNRKMPQRALSATKKSKNLRTLRVDDSFCEDFRLTSMFDSFEEFFLTYQYNYNVDVGVSKNSCGDLELDYDVTFPSEKYNELNEIRSLSLEPQQVIPKEAPSIAQRDTLRSIFNHFGLSFDENKHECLQEGINCNEENAVIHIWFVDKGISGVEIPELLTSLTTLRGLFLGQNQIVGTIPLKLATMMRLEMLWVNDNLITGEFPSQVGNMKRLREVNFHNNRLQGTIPSEVGKLTKLRLFNLGSNDLHGPIPWFFFHIPQFVTVNIDCYAFENPWLHEVVGRLSKSSLFNKLTAKNRTDFKPLEELRVLALHDNHLSGTLHTYLGTLSKLEDLTLAQNDFEGEIPTELYNIKTLKILDLHENRLNGTIHPNIGGSSSLRVVNLYDNLFESTIPTDIVKLDLLNDLNLDFNLFTGTIPPELGRMNNLEHLTMSYNRMRGKIATDLGDLSKLKHLDIRGYEVEDGRLPPELGNLTVWKHVVFMDNGLTSSLPREFGKMESCETLWLQNEGIIGDLPETLGDLPNLEVISFGYNALTGEIPVNLTQAPKLRIIDFEGNELKGSVPRELGNMTELEILHACHNKLIGTLPPEIGTAENLLDIELCHNALEGTIPSELANITGLEEISLEHNNLDGSIPSELKNLKSLKYFAVGNNKLSGTIPKELGDLESLEYLDIEKNELVGSIPPQLDNLTSLESLYINGNDVTGYLWFMCELDSLRLNVTSPMNCSYFCGTPDEECNSNSLNGATCADVGCSGSGTPTCDNNCRLDYSSCIAGADEITFQLELQTDDKGTQTKWEITDEDDNSLVFQSENGYRNYDSITEFRCLDKGCYSFSLSDGGEDECPDKNPAEFDGSFSLLVNDGVAVELSNFRNQMNSHEIGICGLPPAPFPATTPAPSPVSGATKAPNNIGLGEGTLCISVFIKFDFHVDEISWTVTDANGIIVQEHDYLNHPDPPAPFDSVTEDFCLNGFECYTFTISDSWGDGLLFGDRDYDYNIFVNDNEVPGTDPDFGFGASHTLGTNCPAKTPIDFGKVDPGKKRPNDD